jgi:hypothetical protein
VPSRFERRGQARLLAAVVILGAWSVGLTTLVRREYFQGRPQRLAEAALRLSPGATYFAVEQGGKLTGFASTTIDTLSSEIDEVDYFVADLRIAGTTARTSKRSVVKLSRGLSLRTFDTQVDSRSASVHTGGRADGDSAIVFVKFTGTQPTDSQRVSVHGPVVPPALVPIVIALGEPPKVGRKYSVPTFDPATMRATVPAFAIEAESLFMLVDSATFDQDKGEWVGARTDSVPAWRVRAPDAPHAFAGWIDAQGRVVQTELPGGITLKRTALQLAFENWRIARDRATAANAGTGDILERTAIAAGVKPGRTKRLSMTVQLGAPNLTGYDLDGGRQHFSGDTLTVVRERDASIGASVPGMEAFQAKEFRARFRSELGEEPLLQVHNHEVVELAIRIVGDERTPRLMVQKVSGWVFDSLAKTVTSGVPNALAVLHSRRGDCNEHAQLFVALVRALGIPARVASGLLYLNGKFYYSAWAEVWLGAWVAADPTFGQFPADAAHLRLVVGGLSRQSELLQLMGNLKIKVLEAK